MRKNSLADCAELLASRVLRAATGCHEWQGAKCRKGYGALNLSGKTDKAHRIAYVVAHGEIAPGLHILHKCDNRACVNPAHLMLGTNEENIADKVAKDRASKRLTKQSALEIKGMIGRVSQNEIARLFGVNQSTVSRLGAGLRRPYLEGRV